MASDYSLKKLREEFKKKGVFYTPDALGKFILSKIEIMPEEVYDPTCGRGNLLNIFPDNVKKYGQEIDPVAADDAREDLTNADIRVGNTLYNDCFIGKKFSLIVANPPFSISYDPTFIQSEDGRFEDLPCFPPKSKADYLFIYHILAKLQDNGTAYVLEFPGILYRGQREGILRTRLVEMNYIDQIYQIPKGMFTDTNISTVLLVLKKNRGNKDSIHMEDLELGLSRDVTIDEIAENDFTLSINTYVYKEDIRPEVNPIELHEKCHEASLNAFRISLRSEALSCMMEGLDMDQLLEDYQRVLNECKEKGINFE